MPSFFSFIGLDRRDRTKRQAIRVWPHSEIFAGRRPAKMLVGELPKPAELRDKLGLLTKCLIIYYGRKNGNKKDAYRRHPIHLIILFKFKAVAERRQWSSAASKPRRKTRVKLCPHFWAANVPSHQICRLRSASR